MKTPKNIIIEAIYRAVNSPEENVVTYIEKEQIVLDSPSNQFGDYSTNIALQAHKKIMEHHPDGSSIGGYQFPSNMSSRNPRGMAENIVERLKKDKELMNVVEKEKIQIAGPGFINFWLKKDILVDNLMHIDEHKEQYGASDFLKGQKIMFEFAHPNTHKAFHIGHLRNITTGETLSRVFEFLGADVIRANYQGDVGLHIAKAIWGIKHIEFSDPKDIKERAEVLGHAYAFGATAYEEKEEAKEEIHDINAKIYSKTDPEINDLYEETRKWSLDYFEAIYKRVYTKFDRFYFESEVAESGKKIAEEALKSGILEESDGAVIFRGSKYGLHDRVFISGKGLPTYEGKDLGLAKLQFQEYNPDKLIHTVGPEQTAYFQVIFKALEFIMPETKDREIHVPYGWVRLKEGKMSSRTGNVVLGEKLLDDAKAGVIDSYDTPEDVAEMIAVAAVKYSFLRTSLNQDIAFDIKESISLEGNSGPYLQYAIARCNSVIHKAPTFKGSTFKGDLEMNHEEMSVIRSLLHFTEVVEQAATTYSPNLLCNYLYDLAQKYNGFYAHNRILNTERTKNEVLSSNQNKIIGSENEKFRLLLTKGVAQVLKNGLMLLGIESPDRM